MTRWTAARRTRLGLPWVALALAVPGFAAGGPGHAAAGRLVAQETATWVVLARHAEKLDGEDPGLTPDGTERARALAHVLSPWPIEVVYASQYLRTRATAAPLAALLGLEPRVVDAADVSGLAARIRAEGRAAVAVIGHSNTVPALARALGAEGPRHPGGSVRRSLRGAPHRGGRGGAPPPQVRSGLARLSAGVRRGTAALRGRRRRPRARSRAWRPGVRARSGARTRCPHGAGS